MAHCFGRAADNQPILFTSWKCSDALYFNRYKKLNIWMWIDIIGIKTTYQRLIISVTCGRARATSYSDAIRGAGEIIRHVWTARIWWTHCRNKASQVNMRMGCILKVSKTAHKLPGCHSHALLLINQKWGNYIGNFAKSQWTRLLFRSSRTFIGL